ncbi:polysaccharide deacetylase family protein [Solirubrobacter deserti]|uniref:Polysaccharide deacetylase family protein n=1 Tax=Solirubrobacter deserti TaxID=2282478 RepID=A0ABT4RM97_9ACTN|nr:polysaccharide deacetylase family protein [Solirubrobacter deserti]MDA0139637.1 polysaccharide deacetylase family protein [Solirubrobacter deserti]
MVVPALRAEALERHIGVLRSRYRVVPASDLPDAARRRRRGQRIPVAITFDDDLRSHLEVAAPLLRAADAHATFFLTGIGLDGEAFWWQSLQAAIDRHADLAPVAREFGLPAGPPAALAAGIERLAPEARRALAERLDALAGPDPDRRALSGEEIARLTADGFGAGFHTRAHARMTALDDAALELALHEGRARLEAVAGAPMTTIAYPHGDADERVAAAAAAAGVELGFITAMAPRGPDTPLLLLNRPGVLADSTARFAYDLAWTYSAALRARTASSSS